MNIKSLLIGSAAALAVVSGAQAADAVVAAEPEPMEYVRVCDAYGTGFFYIPGTETCLKIGGQLRYEKNWGKDKGFNSVYSNHTRARLHVTAKNDSEWGTVSSWIRIQADQWDNGAHTMNTWFTMGIGGLEFSNFESQWVRFFGYGGRTDWGGDYGYQFAQQISYTAEFDAFKGMVAIEHDRNVNPEGAVVGAGDSKYMPDVVVGASGTFGDWSVVGGVAWDESDESFAVKKIVRGDIGMFGVTLMGLYSDSATNRYFSYDGWSALVGVSAAVTESITLSADAQWYDDESFLVIGDVAWNVASGFDVLLEAGHFEDGNSTFASTSGFLRFQRSF
jgi:opacity protein-like surface antigen